MRITVSLGRRLAAAVPALALAVPLLAAPQARAENPPEPSVERVAGGGLIPWDADFLPDGRMVVTQRGGIVPDSGPDEGKSTKQIWVYEDGSPGAQILARVTVPNVRAQGEAGVMGIAVDVDFADNRYVYVCASREYPGSGGWVNEVLRYRVTSGWSAPEVIFGGMKAWSSHDGCAVEMDESGLLWVSMGDARDEPGAQNRNTFNGKVLRMTRDGRVPEDNPVIDGTRNQVYTLGHRNPQGLAIEPGTGRVYSIEHGPSVDDEVNLLEPGANYGWPCVTGENNKPYEPDTKGCAENDEPFDPDRFTPAAWASGNSTIATSGGTFLRGEQWGDWQNDLVVSVLKDQELRRFDVAADGSLGTPETLYEGQYGRLRGAVAGPGGQLYLTTSNGGGDEVLRVSPSTPSVERISGATRYDLAAAVSAEAYPAGNAEAIVAAGTTFPDALAGSAVGGRDEMPVLLTRPDRLPDSTKAELTRLGVDRITVLGGEASVSPDVVDELRTIAGDVERVDGPNRYAVAAAVSRRWYTPGVDAVFIASGEAFADALAAGPAAATRGAPLLLVRKDSIPGTTSEALKRLAPKNVYVLGGTATISDAAMSRLGVSTGSAPRVRLAGANRYAVAQSVAREFWETSDVTVASGETFADGLTLGAVAGASGSPLLLSRSDRVPLYTGQQMLRLAPDEVRAAGGPVTLDGDVLRSLRTLVATP